MRLRVNGEDQEVAQGLLLGDLLRSLGQDPADMPIAVAVNLEVVPRSEQATLELHDGDRDDVVTAVGGG